MNIQTLSNQNQPLAVTHLDIAGHESSKDGGTTIIDIHSWEDKTVGMHGKDEVI